MDSYWVRCWGSGTGCNKRNMEWGVAPERELIRVQWPIQSSPGGREGSRFWFIQVSRQRIRFKMESLNVLHTHYLSLLSAATSYSRQAGSFTPFHRQARFREDVTMITQLTLAEEGRTTGLGLAACPVLSPALPPALPGVLCRLFELTPSRTAFSSI